jgi:DNA (cytosine-5)-methyltransferase 1
LRSVELCAGAGGQALGLELAGFEHSALVELDRHACRTLKQNRPNWNVVCADIRSFSGNSLKGQVDLLAAGIPCPPFSVAGKQLGHRDNRDLFPEVLRLTRECEPSAILIENVRGLLDKRFTSYRRKLEKALEALDYVVLGWKLLNASDFSVPQLRPRVALVAMRHSFATGFEWPIGTRQPSTVGEALYEEMSSRGWSGAKAWRKHANTIAPTLVGGSRLHGGPDLGPTRARKAWLSLGVDGGTLAEEPPPRGFNGLPRLTVKMCATLQGFPPDWEIYGSKTQAYRQVGNAFPPPVATALGFEIARALSATPARARKAVSGQPVQQALSGLKA